jgi:hypothetical protein
LGPGEGSTVLPELVAQSLSFTVADLYAVYRIKGGIDNDPVYPVGQYGIIFTLEGEGLPAVVVHTDAEGVAHERDTP